MTGPRRILLAIAVVVGGVVALGLVAIAGLAWIFRDADFASTFESQTFATLDDWDSASGFEETLDLEFPPSTSNIRVASDGFQEPIYQLRFTIDSAELPIVESSLGCDGLLSQATSRPPGSVITEEIEWWRPEEAATFQECAGGEAPGRVLQVFVDQSAERTNEVYVVAILL